MLVYGEVIEYLKGLPTFKEYKTRLQKLFELKQITPYPLTYAILERYADIPTDCATSVKKSQSVACDETEGSSDQRAYDRI